MASAPGRAMTIHESDSARRLRPIDSSRVHVGANSQSATFSRREDFVASAEPAGPPSAVRARTDRSAAAPGPASHRRGGRANSGSTRQPKTPRCFEHGVVVRAPLLRMGEGRHDLV